MPRGFDFGGSNRKAEIWIPLHIDLANGDPGNFSFQGVARLKPGVTPEAALVQEDALLQRVRERWADAEDLINFMDAGGFHPIVHSLKEEVVEGMERALWILLGTVGFVLLIACANVANLFLVRTEGRQREMAVRAAMGATRGRLARQYLLESVVLAVVGGALGLVAAWVGTPLLLRMAPPELARLYQISMDGRVLGFTVGVTALAALLFGAAPALRYNLAGQLGILRYAGRGTTEGRERQHLRNALVVRQRALAMVLLVGSGLLVKSFREIRQTDPGFDTQDILTFRISLPGSEYPGAEQPAAFHQQLLERLRALPGVEAAGGVSALPLALGLAALMALILGAVGVYGVLCYVVSQRTQEIRVRMALGARARQVQSRVVASGIKLAVFGLLIGVLGAGALTRLLQDLLFGTEPLDLITFSGMAVLLLAVTIAASYLPARRAAAVDPVESMRME